MQGAGYKIRDARCKMLDVGCWMLEGWEVGACLLFNP